MTAKVDWEAIEREYREGRLSVRAIARASGVSETRIRQNAKKHGWERVEQRQVIPPAKRPIGRPSKYDPAYCEDVIETMGKGYSLTAFAGKIRVDRDTLYEWTRRHPEFSVAVKVAQAARVLVLEGTLLKASSGPEVTSRIFALKNAAPDEWKDKREVEHTHRAVDEMTDDELTRIAAGSGAGTSAPAGDPSRLH